MVLSHPIHRMVVLVGFLFAAAGASETAEAVQNGARRDRSPAIKAAYLVQFARYVWWPPSGKKTGKSRLDRVHILVINADSVGTQLARLQARASLPIRPVVRRVRALAELRAADIQWSHIVYVPDPAVARLVAAAHPNKPVLLVTDGRWGTRSGAAIAFYRSDNKVRLEIAPHNASRRGLELSSRLLRVAGAISRDAGETPR